MSEMTDKKIKMYWVKSKPCMEKFSNLFEPIDNIYFSYVKWNRNERRTRPKNTTKSLGLFFENKEEYRKNHLIFQPLSNIRKRIDLIKSDIGEDYISCHIRRTDIGTIQKKYNVDPHPDSFFDDFIQLYPNHKVFLATDSESTQKRFQDKFKDRVYVHSFINGDGSSRWPNRTTSIKDAVVDLFACIGSYKFLGTNCSSFSGFIKNYREALKCQV
tara:strand:+ start:41 stop:685 length:645 start_codon:yes stop_codon:yes gene_type:complete